MVDMDFRCIQGARITPEVLVLFGSWWGYLGVAKCFPMFPDLFRVPKVVIFEFQQKKSFLGSYTIVNWPYLGRAKKRGQMPLFSTFLGIFLHNLVKEMGKALVPVGPTLLVHFGPP